MGSAASSVQLSDLQTLAPFSTSPCCDNQPCGLHSWLQGPVWERQREHLEGKSGGASGDAGAAVREPHPCISTSPGLSEDNKVEWAEHVYSRRGSEEKAGLGVQTEEGQWRESSVSRGSLGGEKVTDRRTLPGHFLQKGGVATSVIAAALGTTVTERRTQTQIPRTQSCPVTQIAVLPERPPIFSVHSESQRRVACTAACHGSRWPCWWWLGCRNKQVCGNPGRGVRECHRGGGALQKESVVLGKASSV